MTNISNNEIEKLNLKCQTMLNWVTETILHKREMYLPEKTSMKLEGGKIFYNVMPCIVESQSVAGVKIVSRYPQRDPVLDSKLFLYDLNTGYLKGILDADFITTWRTAAVAVHSIKLFAKKDYRIVAFIGLGVIGKATLQMFLETLDKENIIVRIFNYQNCAEKIIKQFEHYQGVKFECFDDYLQMVADADVIVSAITFAETDFANENAYKKGCLLVPIHTRGFQGCDLTFDKIFGDDYGHIQGFKYFKNFKSFNEVTDVVNNRCKGRETDEERIIAYNIGIALHDIVFAQKIFEAITENKDNH